MYICRMSVLNCTFSSSLLPYFTLILLPHHTLSIATMRSFTLLAFGSLLAMVVVAAPTTTYDVPELSAEELAKGTALRFVRRDNKWVPSEELLAEQAAYNENLYIVDPASNRTILNPSHIKSEEAGELGKRAPFNPPAGTDCRMSFGKFYQVVTCQGGSAGQWRDCSYDSTMFKVRDNRNADKTFVWWTTSRRREGTGSAIHLTARDPGLEKLNLV